MHTEFLISLSSIIVYDQVEDLDIRMRNYANSFCSHPLLQRLDYMLFVGQTLIATMQGSINTWHWSYVQNIFAFCLLTILLFIWVADVPEGSFIVRAHTPMSNLFSCLWYNEVERFTPRDQLSFAYTYQKLRRMNPDKPFNLHMFKVKISVFKVYDYNSVLA